MIDKTQDKHHIDYYIEEMKKTARTFYLNGGDSIVSAVEAHHKNLEAIKADIERNVEKKNGKYNEVIGILNRAISFFARDLIRLRSEEDKKK